MVSRTLNVLGWLALGKMSVAFLALADVGHLASGSNTSGVPHIYAIVLYAALGLAGAWMWSSQGESSGPIWGVVLMLGACDFARVPLLLGNSAVAHAVAGVRIEDLWPAALWLLTMSERTRRVALAAAAASVVLALCSWVGLPVSGWQWASLAGCGGVSLYLAAGGITGKVAPRHYLRGATLLAVGACMLFAHLLGWPTELMPFVGAVVSSALLVLTGNILLQRRRHG